MYDYGTSGKLDSNLIRNVKKAVPKYRATNGDSLPPNVA